MFFFTDPAIIEFYSLSLHDALPIYLLPVQFRQVTTQQLPLRDLLRGPAEQTRDGLVEINDASGFIDYQNAVFDRVRSEEHTSELQSLAYLVCRLLLEKKK